MPEYHAWTHMPKAQGGTDPLNLDTEFQWAYAQCATQTILNNTLTAVTFQGAAIDPDATAIDIFDADEPFSLVTKGWYLFYLQIEYTGADYTDERMAEIDISGGGGNWENNDNTFNPRDIQSGRYGAGQAKTLGPMLVDPTARIAVRVKQNSGASQDLVQCRLTVLFLGAVRGMPVGDELFDMIVNF